MVPLIQVLTSHNYNIELPNDILPFATIHTVLSVGYTFWSTTIGVRIDNPSHLSIQEGRQRRRGIKN